jgi:ribosomal protein S18 acetylase RimI-like enzyme
MIEICITHEEFSQNLHFQDLEIRRLSKSNIDELQPFLENFNDFFMLCEGVEASAASMLSACPPSKNINMDKLCLGIYLSDDLIGFIDLIKDYPLDEVLTIGYLLVHPSYQSLKLGVILVDSLVVWAAQQKFKKLTLLVQKQNQRALSFWQKNQFQIVETLKGKLGEKVNFTDILERIL